MKTVLVTGASGFLGQHVVAQLVRARYAVTAHGRRESPFGSDVEYMRGDLADANDAETILTARQWDVVIDLAGPVTGGNEALALGLEVVTAHVRIALNLRRHASGSRLVHASSMTVYGLPTTTTVDEGHPRQPQHLYGVAKLLSEDVLLADPELDTWILRLPGLFSEQRASGALYHFCRAARAGEPVRITTTTPTAWNVLHVADAADAILHAVAAPSRGGGAINISYDEPVELNAVAELIARHANTGSRVERPADVEHPPFHLVSTKATQLLGWKAPSLRERLFKLYADYAAT